MPDFALTRLLHPTVQFRGFNSTACPAYLPPGKMSAVSNLRVSNGVPVVRQPMTMLGGGAATGAVYGAAEFLFDGVPTLFVATGPPIGTAGHVVCYKSVDGGNTWPEITFATGPYGDTRFPAVMTANAPGSRVEFTVVQDQTFDDGVSHDCLIIQNGVQAPRIYALGATNSTTASTSTYETAIVYQPPAPAADGNLSFKTAFANYWPVNNGADITYTNPTISVTGATDASPIVITTASNHYLTDGDAVQISGVGGNLAANGNFYAKVTGYSATTFGLYVDSALGTPVAGSGAYTSGGATTYGAVRLSNASGSAGYNAINGFLYQGYPGSVVAKATFSAPLNLSDSISLVLMGTNQSLFAITGATDATPIVVTTNKPHCLQIGDTAVISGVVGNTAANGRWTVTPLSATTFSLDDSAGNAAYVDGGELLTAPVPFFWQQLGIELIDGSGNTMVLYDPTSGVGGPVFLQLTPQTVQVTSTNADGATTSSTETINAGAVNLVSGFQNSYPIQVATGGFNLADVVGISFEYTGNAPPVGMQFDIYMLAASGAFQGSTAFAASYYATDHRSMGPATSYPTVVPGSVSLSGGPVESNLVVLDDPRFWYDYSVTVGNPPTAALDAGVDRALLFAQLPGQTSLFLCGNVQVGNWTGSAWAFTNSASASFSGNTFTQDLSWPYLNTSYQVMPTGLAMTASAQRLFVASAGTMWYSGADRPFQFNQYVQNDGNGNLLPQSPGSLDIDGENIQAFLNIGSLSGGQENIGQVPNGVSTVFILTDRTLSWATGWDAISLGKRNLLYARGTYAPKSLAPSRTGFFFLDTDLRVIEVNGYMVQPVSRDIVEDRLFGIPSACIPWVWGVELNDRYYLCYTAAGGAANLQALIYDIHVSQLVGEHVWLSDTFPSALNGVAALLPFRNGTQTVLVGFDTSGQCVQHETPGASSDYGQTGVTWSMTFPELDGGLWGSIRVRRCGIVCDANMGTITTTRNAVGRLVQTPATGSVDTTTPTGPRAVKWDGSGVTAGMASNSVSVTLSGASSSGKRLISVIAEVEAVSLDGPDA